LSEQLCKENKLFEMQLSSPHRPTSTIEELVSSSTHTGGSVNISCNGFSLQLSFFAVKLEKIA
jgi:hypothetical protein